MLMDWGKKFICVTLSSLSFFTHKICEAKKELMKTLNSELEQLNVANMEVILMVL